MRCYTNYHYFFSSIFSCIMPTCADTSLYGRCLGQFQWTIKMSNRVLIRDLIHGFLVSCRLVQSHRYGMEFLVNSIGSLQNSNSYNIAILQYRNITTAHFSLKTTQIKSTQIKTTQIHLSYQTTFYHILHSNLNGIIIR